MELELTRSQLVRWRTAVFAIFLASGLSIATWAARVPAIKVTLDVDNIQIGLLLLGAGASSIIGVFMAPVILARIGARRGMFWAMICFAAGVAIIGTGTDLAHSYGLVFAGLVMFGFGNGSLDVMMNVEGAAIEKQSDKTILPLFHAFFSFGTVIGAAVGFLAVAWGLNVFAHTSFMTVLILTIAFFSIVNVPRILYAMTLTGPVQVGDFPWIQGRRLGGMSIFLTTPLFLWSLKARRLDWFGAGTWAAVLLTMVPILTHADPGGQQFGFRYAQDVYPFLLLLTVRGLGGRISVEAWIAIAIGGLFNLWGMASAYFDWWQ